MSSILTISWAVIVDAKQTSFKIRFRFANLFIWESTPGNHALPPPRSLAHTLYPELICIEISWLRMGLAPKFATECAQMKKATAFGQEF